MVILRGRYLLRLFFSLMFGLCFVYGFFYIKVNAYSDDARVAADEKFKQELITSIISAEKIVVTEHSDTQDWSQEDFEATATRVMRKVDGSNENIEMLENRSLPVITYREIELNNYQRLKLLLLIKMFAVDTAYNYSLCLPSFHHQLQFYMADESTKFLDICFQCNQLEWNHAGVLAPSLMYSIMRSEINSLGLSAERDWSDYLVQWRTTHPINIKPIQ